MEGKTEEMYTPPNAWENYIRESQHKVMEAPETQIWKLGMEN